MPESPGSPFRPGSPFNPGDPFGASSGLYSAKIEVMEVKCLTQALVLQLGLELTDGLLLVVERMLKIFFSSPQFN